MTNGSNERMDRIEANLDRITTLLLDTAERQSTTDLELAQLKEAVAQTNLSVRGLMNIAAGHERRITSTEARLDELEGGEPS